MLAQEVYRNDPWKMLVACLISRVDKHSIWYVARQFFLAFPNASSVKSVGKVKDFFDKLRFENVKLADQIWKLSRVWVHDGSPKNWMDIHRNFLMCGSYEISSWRIFIDRILAPVVVEHSDLKQYVANAVTREKFYYKMASLLRSSPFTLRSVRGENVMEVCNAFVRWNDRLFIALDEEENSYVNQKIDNHFKEILRARSLLEKDHLTRQAVVQFRQDLSKPNCTVSAHFQVRDGSMFINVLQRSQDVDMICKDAETINRIACRMCEVVPVRGYSVVYLVSNLHKYI